MVKEMIPKTLGQLRDVNITGSDYQEILSLGSDNVWGSKTKSELGIAETSAIPTTLAELSEDSTHRLVTDAEKSTWNGKQDTLVSGTSIKTINSETLLGSNNILLQTPLVVNTDYLTALTIGSNYEPLKGSDDNYVTDAEKVVISNTSGSNTGDQTISDATISTTDITTNNVSTSKHGFAPKGDGSSTTFLNGTGTYSTPAGTGGGNVNTSGTPIDNDFAKFVNGSDIEGRSYSEVKTDLSLNNVSNVATDDTGYNASSWNGNTDSATKNAIRDKFVLNDATIALNTAKDTNISTNLSEGTSTTTTVDVNSSDGTNATLVSASSSRAGLLTKAKWDEIIVNTAKTTNATHTGDVIGATVLTVDKTAVTDKDAVTALGVDYVMISDTSDSGNLKKALISDFASAGGDMAAATYDPATIAEQLVGLSAVQTLTNKTLTSPVINSPTGITKTNVGLSNVPNTDCTNASNITSGTLSSSVLPPVALTEVAVYANQTAMLTATTEEGDVAVRSDENKSYMHNGGSAGTMADWTELQTPTDSVLSVNGETGTVTLTTGDLTEDTNKKYVSDAQLVVIGNTSGTNTGDDPASDIAYNSTTWNTNSDSATKNALRDKFVTNDAIIALNTAKNTYPSADSTKVGHISVTQDVNLDTMESNITTNNSKVSYPGSANATELNILDGATLTTTEINYVDGVTSAIQTQINGKQAIMGSDDNYVTDAQLVVIGNTSGTNTGDNTVCTSGTATTAITLATARTIAGVSFNGSSNISLNNNAITNGAGYTTNSGTVTSVAGGTGLTSTGGTTPSLSHNSHTGDVTGTTALTIADNAVTLAKMAHGTDGNLITYDTTGAPTFQAATGGGDLWSDPVDSNIIPDTNNTYDIGDATHTIKKLYVQTVQGDTITDRLDLGTDGNVLLVTNNVTRLGVNDSGVQLGAANARVTTIYDTDAMTEDSATALATQQSIKAYVDAQSGGG